MASVEELLVKIDASTENLRREMKRADDSVGSFQRSVDKHLRAIDRNFEKLDRMARGLVGSLGVLGGAFSVGAISRFALDTVSAADKIGKLSAQVGVGAETLQEWQFAASQASIPAGTLESSLERLTRRIGEARHGSGELAAISDELGLSLGSTEEVFVQIAEAIKGAKDEQEATRIAFKAFDSEGRVLTRMLRDGSDGLRQYGDEAQRLGIVLSSENLAKAEKISDELDKLNRVIRVNLQEGLLSGFGDDIGEFSDAISDELADDLRDFGEAIGEGFRWIVENREQIVTALEAVGGAIAGRLATSLVTTNPLLRTFGAVGGAALSQLSDETQSRIGLAFSSANRRAFGVQDLGGEVGAEIDLLQALPDDEELRRLQQMDEQIRAMVGPAEEIELALVQVHDRIMALKYGEPIVIRITKGMNDLGKGTTAGAKAAHKLDETLDKLHAKYDDGFARILRYEDAQADLLQLYNAGRITLDEWTAALNDQLNSLDGMDGTFEEVADGVNVMATAFEEAVKRVDTMFVDMWRDILSGARMTFDGVKDMLRNLGAELLHANFTRPLLGSVTGALGIAGPASAAGSGGIGSLLSTGSNLLSLGGNALTSIGTGAVFSGIGTGFGMASANIGAAGYFGGMGANMALAGSSLSSGAIGTALGAAIPYLAPVVALAAILPGLLKDKTDPRVGLKTGGEYFEDGVTMDSAFGTVGYRAASHGMKAGDERWSAVLQTVVSLDNAVASLMSEGQVADTRSRLHGYMGSLTDLDDLGEFGISAMISERMRVVVEDMSGVMGDAFRAVFSGFEVSAEDLVTMVDGLVQLSAQLDVDVMEEYQRAAAEAGRSLTDVYHDQVAAVRDLAADLTISAEGIQTLTAANAARMQVELQLLAALDAAAASIDQTLGATIERITLDLLDQQGQYDRIRGQAEALAASLNLMTDPTQIQDAVAEIDRLTNAAYGLLDETQRQSMGSEFVSFLQDVQGLAESRLDEARQDVVDQSSALRDVIESSLANAASQFSAAASEMRTAAAEIRNAATLFPRAIRVEWDVAEVNG